MIRAQDLIALFRQALDEEWGYIYGAKGQEWTAAKQKASKRDMTVKYGARWIGRRVADCSGLFAWAFQQLGGSIYHGSNTIWNKWLSARGTLKNGARADGQPLRAGTAVFLLKNGNRHHIGLFIGGDTVIEAKGTIYGVVTSKLDHWDEWGELKNVVYGEGADMSEMVIETVRRGDKGVTVLHLQKSLMAQGYALPKYGADGSFGAETEAAVKQLQRDNGFVIDGIAGAQVWGHLTEQDAETPQDGANEPLQLPDTGETKEETAAIPKALYDAMSAYFKGV